MPKTSSRIDERQRAICGRLRELRLRERFSQQHFGNAAGLTRNIVAAMETACSPVHFRAGRAVCSVFNVCQRWLAEGAEPYRGNIKIPAEIEAQIGPRCLFSKAYDDWLRPRVLSALRDAWDYDSGQSLYQKAGGTPQQSAAHYARHLQTIWFEKLSIEQQQNLYRWLSGGAAMFRQQLQGGAPPSVQDMAAAMEKIRSEINLLTDVSEFRNLSAMQLPTLKELLDRTREIVKPAGMKAALAVYLHVPPSRVSEWLADKYKPSGAIVLQLLKWVSDPEERQQKSPGSATNTAKGKTTQRKGRS